VTVTTSPRRLRAAAIAAAAVLAAALAVATPAGGAAPDDRPPSLLAKLAAGADGAGLARDHGLVLARSFPEIGWAELEVPSGDPLAAGRELLRDGRVFRLDFQRRGETLAAGLIPRDPFTTTPISLGQGLTSDYHWRQANFFPAWDVSRGSSAVRIAVVDSEFDTEHPDLKNKFTTGYNAERQTGPYRSSNVRASDEQIQGALANPDNNSLHGTHVAGLVGAATDNLVGVSGAGFDSVLVPVKVSLNFQVGDTADAKFVGDAVEGIRWAADNGASVINMSFGTPRFHQSLLDAVNYAAGRGVMLVAAAGNTQTDPNARGTIQYPAAFPNVLAVAATDQNSAVTNFSTNGSFVDVAAPGSQILSTWDVRAPGIVVNGQAVQGYRFLSGTSMASPIVAGLAGLIKAVRPDMTPAEIEGMITATAVDVGAGGRDPQFGAGIINADAAVRAALAYVRPVPVAAAPPPPPPDTRKRVRIFYSCKIGTTKVAAGRRARLQVKRNVRLVCKGRTAPAVRRTRIEVQRFAARGGWKRIARVKTNNRGRFGFTLRLTTAGNWTVRVAYGGNAALKPAGSLSAKLRVTPPR
jgi:subtilisin family serine protease